MPPSASGAYLCRRTTPIEMSEYSGFYTSAFSDQISKHPVKPSKHPRTTVPLVWGRKVSVYWKSKTGQGSVSLKELDVHVADFTAVVFTRLSPLCKSLTAASVPLCAKTRMRRSQRVGGAWKVACRNGESLGAALRKQKSLRKCFTQTIVPPTVSYSEFGLDCSIIGRGFRWKGTTGEKAFFGGGKWFSSEEEKLFSAAHNGRWEQGRSPIAISPFNGAFT